MWWERERSKARKIYCSNAQCTCDISMSLVDRQSQYCTNCIISTPCIISKSLLITPCGNNNTSRLYSTVCFFKLKLNCHLPDFLITVHTLYTSDKMAHVGRLSAAGWISFRNLLLALITMQIIVLITIGFSAPSEIERSLGDLFRGPFLASLHKQVRTKKKIKSLGFSPKLWKKLSEQWEQVGMFDTQGAFTMNFLPGRMHPSFR